MAPRGALAILAVFAACAPAPSSSSGGSSALDLSSLSQPPPNAVGSFAISIPSLTLPAGDEQRPCWIFPIDLRGPSHVVGGAHLTGGAGMHHGTITARPKTGDGMRHCADDDAYGAEGDDVAGGGALLFASTDGSATLWQSFPPGTGYRIEDDFEIVARMHYINPTQGSITFAPKYEWITIDEAKVDHLVAPFAWTYRDVSIPPQSELTVTSPPCPLAGPMHIVSALPHMHLLGTHLGASIVGGDGSHFLDTKGYSSERIVFFPFVPALDLSEGGRAAGVTFSCTWKNTFARTITLGTGTGEMCAVLGYAYPPEAATSLVATATSCVASTRAP